MPATSAASRPALMAADTAKATVTRTILRGCRIIRASARNSAGIIGSTPSSTDTADRDPIA